MNTTKNEISNSDDVIDSRDVIARIEELQEERQELLDATESGSGSEMAKAQDALTAWDADNLDELNALLALQEQAEPYAPDWRHGESLIRDSYFKEYAQELAEDIGAVKPDAQWPYTCIDWEKAAEELQADYTAVEFDGVTYWIR